MKLLIVEDNHLLTASLKLYMRPLFAVDFAKTGHDALKLARNNTYEAIVLDLGLPDMSGQEVCQRLRTRGLKTPILVATGIKDPTQCITLLDCGADDYITKPYVMDTLLNRLDALAHREPPKEPLTFGVFVIDVQTRAVIRDGVYISLRKKEFELLEFLAQNKGRVVTRSMILNQVWETASDLPNNTIEVHVKHLRDKIDKPFNTSHIKTVHRSGYMLEVDNTG